VTYDAASLIDPTTLEPHEHEAVGYAPGLPSPHPLGIADELEITVHPFAVMRDDEAIAVMVDRWQAYGPEHLPAEWYEDGWSAWEVEAWQAMRAAHGREEKRRLDSLKDGA
tara:strand:+ start:706 stop:1038 length:333 start_codon:yes stop_codon:yes gene_type:complete